MQNKKIAWIRYIFKQLKAMSFLYLFIVIRAMIKLKPLNHSHMQACVYIATCGIRVWANLVSGFDRRLRLGFIDTRYFDIQVDI